MLGVEPENRRLSLGVKQLQPDVWDTFFAQHRVGDVIKGKILRTAQFGAFVEIAEGVEGLCHVSEAVDETGQPGHAGRRRRARVQDRQDEPGREEGRPQHPGHRRRSQPRRGGELQGDASRRAQSNSSSPPRPPRSATSSTGSARTSKKKAVSSKAAHPGGLALNSKLKTGN